MPVRSYKSSVISTFITIWLFSFIMSVITLVDYYNSSAINRDRYREVFIITIPICIISGLIAVCEHNNMNRNGGHNIPV